MAQTVELSSDGSPRVSTGPDPHASLIGKSLLHYRVVEVIGQGGMSVVYRGRDENLHRDVAIKVLHPFLAEKAECRARLAREARAVARLEHPHVLKVFDFSGDPDTIDEMPGGNQKVRGFAEGFIVAELVKGPTLKRYVEDHELWKVPEAGAMVVWQIANALEHAHQHGVVHRDIKPENVMVREDGWIKLMDFGIAQIADQKGLTVTGTLLGSPAHMAPECIDGHAADERSDLFSLGTVLYWITTGCLPFEALTPHALLKQIVEGRSLPAQQRNPKISDDLARVLAKSMATKPQDRYENAGAFVKALAELLDKSGVPADPERLREMLAVPDVEILRISSDVRATFLKRAEQHVADGSPARALSCLGRVLAEDKDDAEARALIEKAGLPDDAEITGDDQVLPGLVAPSSLATTTPGMGLGTPGMGLVTGSSTGSTPTSTLSEPRAFGRVVQQAAVVGVAIGLISIAFVLARRFDDKRVDDVNTKADAATNADGTNASTSATDDMELGKPNNDANSAAANDTNKNGIDDDARKKQRERDKAKITKLAANDPTKVIPPPPVSAVLKRNVAIRAKPWADIYVDDQLVAEGKTMFDVELPVGKHVIKFKNKGGRDVERSIEILPDGAPPELAVTIEPRPALLSVTCNQPDAFVSVNNKGGKRADETVATPLPVGLGERSSASFEVTIYKKGFKLVNRKIDFQAGQRAFIDVKLEPEEPAP